MGSLGLTSGRCATVELDLRFDDITSGGQRYSTSPERVGSRLEVTRTVAGWALKLGFSINVSGPCSRCLKDAAHRLDVDAREVDQPGTAEELTSPYIERGVVDVSSWARDALILALPPRILCRRECRGLCSVCGADLNSEDPADHEHKEGGDPRWAKLRELELE